MAWDTKRIRYVSVSFVIFTLICCSHLHRSTEASEYAKNISSDQEAPSGKWNEIEYKWGSLSIIIRSNIGLYSSGIQHLAKQPNGRIGNLSPIDLAKLIQFYFMATSSTWTDDTFMLQLDKYIEQWGPGHSFPIIAAVAIENIQRPIPSIYAGRVKTHVFGQEGKLEERKAAAFDPSIPGTLNISIHGNEATFRLAAKQAGVPFARAYYDPSRNELALRLDMDAFNKLYGYLENNETERVFIVPAFINFVTEAFNDDSGHELAHAYQKQTSNPAYMLPAIAEGEAQVQGFVRRRAGLLFSLQYNTREMWISGRFDSEVLQYRLKVLNRIGRPPYSPSEVQRLRELSRLQQQQQTIPVSTLLSYSTPHSFYSGEKSEVLSRYLHSWALCLVAIRQPSTADLLRTAVSARLKGIVMIKEEAELDARLSSFIRNPIDLKIKKEQIISDAESFYTVDPSFAGIFYLWLYIVDPNDMLALIYLGDALFRGGDLSAANKYYNEARRTHPESAMPLLRLGDIQNMAGHFETAKMLWKQAENAKSTDDGEELFKEMARTRPSMMKK